MEFIKKNLNLLANGAAAFFSLIALICMAGSGLTAKSGSYKMTESCFGIISDGYGAGLVVCLIIVILLILAAAALIVLPIMGKDLAWLKWVALGCAALAFLAFILFLSTKSIYVGQMARDLGVSRSNIRSSAKGTHVGGGAVFAAIFSLFAAGCFALPTILGCCKKAK